MDASWLDNIFSDEYVFHDRHWGDTPLSKGTVIEVVDRSEPHEEGNWRTDLFIVIRVEHNDEEAYFKKTGYHASHDGEHWDSPWTEVMPKKRAITTWEETYEEVDSYDSYDFYGSF